MVFFYFPGRTGTPVNDRLRSQTEINGDRSRSPCTTSVYGAERQKTDSVYDGREKIQKFGQVIFDTPFTEINANRLRSCITVCDHIRSLYIFLFLFQVQSLIQSSRTVSVFIFIYFFLFQIHSLIQIKSNSKYFFILFLFLFQIQSLTQIKSNGKYLYFYLFIFLFQVQSLIQMKSNSKYSYFYLFLFTLDSVFDSSQIEQ